MSPFWSNKKADVALSATKIPLETVKELADLVPIDFVGPILGLALKIVEMIEVSPRARFPMASISDVLRSLIPSGRVRERTKKPVPSYKTISKP